MPDLLFCDSNISFLLATIDITLGVGRGGGGGGPLLSIDLGSIVAEAVPLRAWTLLKLASAAFISSCAFSRRLMLVSMSETGEILKRLLTRNYFITIVVN